MPLYLDDVQLHTGDLGKVDRYPQRIAEKLRRRTSISG